MTTLRARLNRAGDPYSGGLLAAVHSAMLAAVSWRFFNPWTAAESAPIIPHLIASYALALLLAGIWFIKGGNSDIAIPLPRRQAYYLLIINYGFLSAFNVFSHKVDSDIYLLFFLPVFLLVPFSGVHWIVITLVGGLAYASTSFSIYWQHHRHSSAAHLACNIVPRTLFFCLSGFVVAQVTRQLASLRSQTVRIADFLAELQSGAPSVENILIKIPGASTRCLGFDAAALWMTSEEDKTYTVLKGSSGLPKDWQKGKNPKHDDVIWQRVRLMRAPLLFRKTSPLRKSDLRNQSKSRILYVDRDLATRCSLAREWLTIPIFKGAELVGKLNLDYYRTGRPISRSNILLLQIVADNIGRLLEYSFLLEHFPVNIIKASKDGTLDWVNQACVETMRMSFDDLTQRQRKAAALFSVEHSASFRQMDQDVMRNLENRLSVDNIAFVGKVRRRVRMIKTPLTVTSGHHQVVTGVQTIFWDEGIAPRSMRHLIASRQFFLELDHRIKNVLHDIVCILTLERKRFAHNEPAGHAIEYCIGYVMASARLHNTLTMPSADNHLDIGYYLTQVIEDLRTAYAFRVEALDIKLKVEGCTVFSSRDALMCGLCVNELVFNALRHGYSGVSYANVQVVVNKTDAAIVLKVCDNGRGIDPSVRKSEDEKLVGGMRRLEELLFFNSRGTLNASSADGRGTCVTAVWKAVEEGEDDEQMNDTPPMN